MLSLLSCFRAIIHRRRETGNAEAGESLARFALCFAGPAKNAGMYESLASISRFGGEGGRAFRGDGMPGIYEEKYLKSRKTISTTGGGLLFYFPFSVNTDTRNAFEME